ncbi:MAG: MFS transporter [Spirochaetaceae bacterium]
MSSATTMPATSGISRLIALLAGAHFAHHVLTALLVPLLPFIRDEFGLSYAQSGIVNSAFTLSYGLSQLPAGWMADRVGPRYMLLVGISGVAVAGAFIGLSPVFALLLAGLVLMGVAGGGYHPAASAVISKVVSPERRGRALGIHIIGGSSSHFLAPLIAAGLVALVGWRGSFLSLSVPVGVLGLAVFLMIERRIHHVDGYARAHAGAQSVEREESAGAEAGPAAGGAAGDARARRRSATAVHMTFFLILTGIISAAVSSTIPLAVSEGQVEDGERNRAASRRFPRLGRVCRSHHRALAVQPQQVLLPVEHALIIVFQ